MPYELLCTAFLPRPREEVFDFFADAANLETITPPWLGFKILTALPIEMEAGAILEYRLRLRGVPISWRTRIGSWEHPVRFTDTQERGPYRLWNHEHRFEEVDGGTLMTDRVLYDLLPVPFVHRLFVAPELKRIFGYRSEVVHRIFGGAPAGGVSRESITIRALD